MGLIRLNKYLAEQGVASRRKCDEFIAAGMVKINGEVVREMGVKVDPERDKVEVDGEELAAFEEELVYIKLNKPKGYECSTNGDQTVYDLVDCGKRVFTVGRLDKESEGLILLTNDGQLTYKLTHPSFEKEKEYEVTVDKFMPDVVLEKLGSGVTIMGRKTSEAGLERVSGRKFRIILTEGMNRQIRRMCRKVGFRVHRLVRVRIGEILLGELEQGKWEYLSEKEMEYVRGL